MFVLWKETFCLKFRAITPRAEYGLKSSSKKKKAGNSVPASL
jgi:hypothetical protein